MCRSRKENQSHGGIYVRGRGGQGFGDLGLHVHALVSWGLALWVRGAGVTHSNIRAEESLSFRMKLQNWESQLKCKAHASTFSSCLHPKPVDDMCLASTIARAVAFRLPKMVHHVQSWPYACQAACNPAGSRAYDRVYRV